MTRLVGPTVFCPLSSMPRFVSALLLLSLCLPPPRILLVTWIVHPSVTPQLFSFSFLLSTFPCIVTYTSSPFWTCLITSSTLPSVRLTSIAGHFSLIHLDEYLDHLASLPLFLSPDFHPIRRVLLDPLCLTSSSASLSFPLSPFLPFLSFSTFSFLSCFFCLLLWLVVITLLWALDAAVLCCCSRARRRSISCPKLS